jgi:hypothetical protein
MALGAGEAVVAALRAEGVRHVVGLGRPVAVEIRVDPDELPYPVRTGAIRPDRVR